MNGDDFLYLYHITKESAMLAHILAIPCENNILKVSISDNILLCHCHMIQKSVLYDIRMTTSSSLKLVRAIFNDRDGEVLLPIGPPTDIVMEDVMTDDMSVKRIVINDFILIPSSGSIERNGTNVKWQVCGSYF